MNGEWRRSGRHRTGPACILHTRDGGEGDDEEDEDGDDALEGGAGAISVRATQRGHGRHSVRRRRTDRRTARANRSSLCHFQKT